MDLDNNKTLTDSQELDILVEKTKDLKKEISKIIIGQEDIINQVLISIFSIH